MYVVEKWNHLDDFHDRMVYDHFLLLLYQMLKRGAEFDFIYTDF